MSNLNLIQMIRHLNTLSIPSFYDHADVGQALPFIAIHTSQPQGFRADNVNYQRRWDFRIDLYAVKKDLELEAEIEALLKSDTIWYCGDPVGVIRAVPGRAVLLGDRVRVHDHGYA